MSIRLDDIEKKELPFEVPEGYFNDLKASILEKVDEDSVNTPVRSLWERTRWAVAAGFTLLAVVGGIYMGSKGTSSQNLSSAEELLDQVSGEALMAYASELDWNEEELLSGLGDEMIGGLMSDPGDLESLDISSEDLDGLIDELEIETELL